MSPDETSCVLFESRYMFTVENHPATLKTRFISSSIVEQASTLILYEVCVVTVTYTLSSPKELFLGSCFVTFVKQFQLFREVAKLLRNSRNMTAELAKQLELFRESGTNWRTALQGRNYNHVLAVGFCRNVICPLSTQSGCYLFFPDLAGNPVLGVRTIKIP